MPQDFHLVLLIHAHQPCGNFEHVLERAYETSYLPFLEHLEAYPGVRVGLHYSGPLLTWIEVHRPEYFSRVKKLVQSGQVELVGGGFYEPILISIPPEDQREQISRLALGSPSVFGSLSFPARWPPQTSLTRSLMTCISFPRASSPKSSLAPTSRKTAVNACGSIPARRRCAISSLLEKSRT